MHEDLVSGRYKRHMAQLSRRPDQLKTPLLWKNGIVESCVWMAAGCYFEWPSLLFHIPSVTPISKEIVSLRHLVRWCKKRYWHEDGFRCCRLKGDLCGEFSFGFALDGHRLSPLRFRQSVMVFHIPGQLLIDTQCSEPTPQCETGH